MENYVNQRTFTRQQFYEFVWSAPLATIAQELNCKVPMLCDVCARFAIPRPYNGYWTLVAKGKPPEITPLPPSDDPGIQSLTFYFGDYCITTLNQVPRELQYDQEVRELLEKARKLGPLIIPAKLSKPNRLVAITKAEDDRRIRNEPLPYDKRFCRDLEDRRARLAIAVSSQQLGRAYRIMDAFIKRIELLGGEVKVVEPRFSNQQAETQVWLCGEHVESIRIREKQNQMKIVNPKAEYSWDRVRTDLIPSGRFVFEFGVLPYATPVATDRKGELIEDELGRLVIRLIHQLGEERLSELERQEQARKRAELESFRIDQEAALARRKAVFEKNKSDEQAKVDELVDHAQAWKQAGAIRQYLETFGCVLAGDTGAIALNSKLAQYLKWGHQIADRIDPLCESPRSILDEEFEVSC